MKNLDILWEGLEPRSWERDYQSWVQGLLEGFGAEKWEVSITFSDDLFIRELNRVYRNKDEPTDILSFPQDAADRPDMGQGIKSVLGDLIISLDTLPVNAAYFSVPEDEELKRLTIHGLLHLQGWEHETNEAGEPMLVHQEEILKEFTGVKILK